MPGLSARTGMLLTSVSQDTTIKESEWLTQARLGDPRALRRYFDAYQPLVARLCGRLLWNRTDAEDATQLTFLRAFRALPDFRAESSLKTWTLRIAYNECMGLLRARKPTPLLIEESLAVPAFADSIAERMAVQQAMTRLNPEARAILTLYYWENLNYEEIAEVLGLSLSAVKMRLLRAKDAFRRHYEE